MNMLGINENQQGGNKNLNKSNQHIIANLKEFISIGERIQLLDPLNLDSAIKSVPIMNDINDVDSQIKLLQEILPNKAIIDSWSFEETAAATRDIGILLGSIRSYGLEPCKHIKKLEEILILIGLKTNLPPRDNVIHYTFWNPKGVRQRQYSNLEEESHLIESVRMAYPSLLNSLIALIKIYDLHITDAEFKIQTEICLNNLKIFITVINDVKKTVDPLIFARKLRIFFDPIVVGGLSYKGPGAVELPLFLIDHLLWSSDTASQEIFDFQGTYLPDIPPFMKEIYLNQKGNPALATILKNQFLLLSVENQVKNTSVKFIEEALDLLIQFRSAHYPLATKAYDSKGKQHNYSQGSGGYSTQILKQILKEIINAKKQYIQSIKKLKQGLFIKIWEVAQKV